jgi:DeoR family transcriptional regulator of aga operon
LSGFLGHLHVDLAFIGIHSMADGRLLETSIDVSMTKKKMIESAARVVVLIDSSKFEHSAFFEVGGLDDIDVVITDHGISAEARVMIEDSETELVIAGRTPATARKGSSPKQRRKT